MYLKEIDTTHMECAFEMYQIPDYVLETVPEDCRGDITGAVYDVSSGELGEVYLTESNRPYDNYARYHEPSYWQPDVPATDLNDASLQGELPEWPSEHSDKAVREGWDIWDSEGSENGVWQVQRIDDPEAFDDAAGFKPPKLASDGEAFRIVANGALPHHAAALAFLKAHNPMEYQAVMRFAKMSDAELKEVQRLVLAAIQAMVNKDDLAVMCATCTAVNLSKEWATEVLRHYPCTLLVEDNYQDDDLFSAALCQIIDGFEYPNHSHQTVEEVLKEYGV